VKGKIMAKLLSAQRSIDRSSSLLRNAHAHTPAVGWIRAVRTAMGMTQADLARLLKITQRSLHQLEVSESKKTIRLASLEKVAEEMNCDLVYAFIPRKPLESVYEAQAMKMAQQHVKDVEHNMRLEKQDHSVSKKDLDDIARELIRKNAVSWNTKE
jgi:predicted DNA-binding mobile mystery protein A